MDLTLSSFQPAAVRGKIVPKAVPAHAQAQKTFNPATDALNLRFAGEINKDYSVEVRVDTPVNAHTASAVQRGLLMRNLMKAAKKAPGSVKLFLDGIRANAYVEQDKAALADSMALVKRPVDVVVKSFSGDVSTKAYLSATGKRLMYAGAEIALGPVQTRFPQSKNKDVQVRREFFVEYLRDLEDLLISRAGAPSREAAFESIDSGRDYNSLQALMYGSKGLTDAVLVGHDQAITRADLEKFYRKKKMTPEQIEKFNADYLNVYKVPTRPLKDVLPDTVPPEEHRFPLYKSLKDMLESANAKAKANPADARPEAPVSGDKPADKADKKDGASADEKRFTIYQNTGKGIVKTDKLGNNLKVTEEGLASGVTMLDNVPDEARGVLDDDVIFFNESFHTGSAEQISEALLSLDDKKAAQSDPSNIKIAINSPGGSVWSGQELRSTIKSLKTPVDVIVQGMAASCGTWLLSSATGNRLATPNARLMIHEAAFGTGYNDPAVANEAADGLNQSTRNYVGIVAQATGRPFKQVWEDFKLDVWMNPLEGLFYGDKGMIDGILVGPDKAITREDVNAFLLEKFGTQEKVDKYIQQKIKSFREPQTRWKPEEHERFAKDDPFATPLRTITEIAAKSAKPLSAHAGLAKSLPRAGTTIDHVVVKSKEKD